MNAKGLLQAFYPANSPVIIVIGDSDEQNSFDLKMLKLTKQDLYILQEVDNIKREECILFCHQHPWAGIILATTNLPVVRGNISPEETNPVQILMGVDIVQTTRLLTQRLVSDQNMQEVSICREESWYEALNQWPEIQNRIHAVFIGPEPVLPVSAHRLLAAAWHYYHPDSQLIDISANIQSGNRMYQLGRILSRGVVLFGILMLLSQVFISGMKWKTEHWQRNMEQSGSQWNEYQNLLLERDSLTDQLTQLQSVPASRSSWYLDRIATMVPEEIVFQRFMLFPTSKELKSIAAELADAPIHIVITGHSNQTQAISAFVRQLRQSTFLAEVKLFRSEFQYQYNHHQFIILLTLADHEIPIF